MDFTTLRPLGLLALTALATYQLGLKAAQRTCLYTEWREQAQAEAGGVEVRLSFVGYEPRRGVFEADYRNPTQHPLVVDPAAFQYEASRMPAPAPDPKARRPKPLPGTEVTAAVAAASMALPLPPLPPKVG